MISRSGQKKTSAKLRKTRLSSVSDPEGATGVSTKPMWCTNVLDAFGRRWQGTGLP